MGNKQIHLREVIRILLISLGFICVGLGFAGIFLPVLPTTPFLLLSAALFAKSSPRFYKWLLQNKWFGSYIHNFRNGKGIPVKSKVIAITFLWFTIFVSICFFITNNYVRIALIAIAMAVSIYLISIKAKVNQID